MFDAPPYAPIPPAPPFGPIIPTPDHRLAVPGFRVSIDDVESSVRMRFDADGPSFEALPLPLSTAVASSRSSSELSVKSITSADLFGALPLAIDPREFWDSRDCRTRVSSSSESSLITNTSDFGSACRETGVDALRSTLACTGDTDFSGRHPGEEYLPSDVCHSPSVSTVTSSTLSGVSLRISLK